MPLCFWLVHMFHTHAQETLVTYCTYARTPTYCRGRSRDWSSCCSLSRHHDASDANMHCTSRCAPCMLPWCDRQSTDRSRAVCVISALWQHRLPLCKVVDSCTEHHILLPCLFEAADPANSAQTPGAIQWPQHSS